MHIRYGFSIDIRVSQPGATVLRLDIHPDERSEISEPDHLTIRSAAGAAAGSGIFELDRFRNICREIDVSPGFYTIEAEGIAHHPGFLENAPPEDPEEGETDPEAAAFLEPTAFCDVGNLDLPSALEGNGSNIIERICQYITDRAWPTDTLPYATQPASETFSRGLGSSTDRIHLAIALFRKKGIPARYCQGYRCGEPGGHSVWFEIFAHGRWWVLDLTRDEEAIGRLLVARGRDAADVPTFTLAPGHSVERALFFAEEVSGARFPVTSLQRRHHWQRHRTFTRP